MLFLKKKNSKNIDQLVHQFSVVKEINRLPSLNSFPQLFSRKIKKKKKETLLFLSFILRIGNKNLSICHEYSIKRKLACQRGWERERERVGTKSRSRDSGSPWRGAPVKFLFPSSRSADGRRLSQRASNPVSLVFFSPLLALFLNAPGYIVPRCDDPSRALTAISKWCSCCLLPSLNLASCFFKFSSKKGWRIPVRFDPISSTIWQRFKEERNDGLIDKIQLANRWLFFFKET